MIGKTISHYKILEQLGRGGMGVVYKAEDTKLKRTVALKFLPPELTRDPESKKRFIREAQAASSLDHPNICTIHEINETDDGQLFIVMACYEGLTLRDKIKDERLKIEEAIDIIIQIGQGLNRAHEEGIVHRDIKPANIIITDRGEVKILDFGLTKLAGQAQLTKDTSTLGTVAYMSPEQVGGKEADQRTDIWSLGVVLYEMLTGEPPFKGDYEQAIIYAILNEKPPPLSTDENIFYTKIEKIISRALNKNPQERYASVADIVQELNSVWENLRNNISQPQFTKTKRTKFKAIIISSVIIFTLFALLARFLFFPSSEPEESIKSLVVLPFLNMNEDPETNFLGFPLADQIIGGLNYLQNINVRASSSVRQYENKKVNPQQVGNDLDVDYVLSGNYLVEGNKLVEGNIIRLNVELVEVNSNDLIWRNSKPLEVSYENTFELQDLVAHKIIDRLKIQFAQDEQDRMYVDVPQNPLAYEYFLRNKSCPLSVEGSLLAVEMLKKSIALDSTYAPAYADLGYHKIRLAQHAVGGAVVNYQEAEEHLRKALSINEDQFDAIIHLSGLYTDRGKPGQAIDFARKALNLNPNSAWAQYRLSYICRYTGLLFEGEKAAEKVIKLDPHNSRLGAIMTLYLFLGKYERALEIGNNYKESPHFHYYRLGEIYSHLNMVNEAIRNLNIYLKKEPESMGGLLSLALKSYLNGDLETGLKAIRTLEESQPFDSETFSSMSRYYALFGDHSGCVRMLRKAIEGGFFCYPFFLTDPYLDPVRDDPEFQKVLEFAKEKHEAFKQKYFSYKD